MDWTKGTLPAIETPWAKHPHEAATAIVLAGGESTRMGVDKRMLPIMGKPLIQHELIVSCTERVKFAFLNARTVPDEVTGEGPLRGIASALAVSSHDLNFVVACDIPWLNMRLLRDLLRQACECDCVVPITDEGYYEPLFAVYRKSALPAMQQVLANRQRRVIAAFRHCRVKTVSIHSSDKIMNINTMHDYRALIGADNSPVTNLSSSTAFNKECSSHSTDSLHSGGAKNTWGMLPLQDV
jgi:molybdopterin-guanine dinucleotide biosynthesis protein A